MHVRAFPPSLLICIARPTCFRPSQVLDGCVHDECGPELFQYLQTLPEQPPYADPVGQRIRCPVGSSVVSPAFGGLRAYFGHLIHTVPPFRGDAGWADKLASCYVNSFRLAWPAAMTKDTTAATVLLGAGCRGLAVDDAARVAAQACHTYVDSLTASNSGSSAAAAPNATTGTAPLIKYGGNDDDSTHASHRILHFVLREEDHCNILLEFMSKESKNRARIS